MLARNRHLVRQLQQARAALAAARQRVAELERDPRPAATAVATASNSSLPPSANPIGARPPVVKRPTGRRPGGQVGHVGASRALLPAERVDRVVEHRPAACRDCQGSIAADAAGAVVVGRHQVFELPPVAVVVTEHQSLACRCARCGCVTRGAIPPDVAASCLGPRLSAAVGLLGGSMKGSKRDVALMLGEVLGCPVAVGSVSARERELSDALAGPYQALVASAAAAKVKYVDETGWKLKGKARWLFASADADQVVYRVERARTRAGFRALLGGAPRPRGVSCTDRAGIYDMLKLTRRQLCWAHLKRDFTAAVERGGAGEAAATRMLAVGREMFELWHRFERREVRRAGLRAGVGTLRERARGALADGAACGQPRTAGLCRALLKREGALWRFAGTPGLEPTNNRAERALRPAVIARKVSQCSKNTAGAGAFSAFVSVIGTLVLRGCQSVVDGLSEVLHSGKVAEQPP